MLISGATLSEPTAIAEAVADAIRGPSSPFRVPVGSMSPELTSARSGMTDEEWIDAAGGTTDHFVARFRAATGVDLRSERVEPGCSEFVDEATVDVDALAPG